MLLVANVTTQVATTMDSFEKQFENLDVQAEYVGTAMGNTTAMSTPQEDVDLLMQQVADEHNISLVHAMPVAGSLLPTPARVAAVEPPAPVPVAVDEEDELSRRLAELKVIDCPLWWWELRQCTASLPIHPQLLSMRTLQSPTGPLCTAHLWSETHTQRTLEWSERFILSFSPHAVAPRH